MNPLHKARFYGILDASYVPPERWVEKCRALLQGGADIVQLRAKSATATERRALLERVLPLFAECDTPLIINDDVELALAHPGLGLHVGQDDLEPRAARERLGPDRLLGLSTHSPLQAASAVSFRDVLSYFAVGPVFATKTKPDYTPVGLDLVKHVATLERTADPLPPWFCIGGINRQNVHRVRGAGGRRVVAVSDVLCADDTAEAVRTIRAAME